MSSAVSVIGCGNMGSALARALASAGHSVTVWNRSPERAEALVAAGATTATTPAEAVEASSVIVICINDYPTGMSLLDESGVALEGKQIIQLTTGTPDQAMEMDAWFSAQNAAFLEGMVMVLPRDVGTADARMIYAGSRETFDAALPVLSAFGGTQKWIGERIGAVSVLGVGGVGVFYLQLQAFILMASAAATFDVDLETVFDELSRQQHPVGLAMQSSLPAIAGDLRDTDELAIRRGVNSVRTAADFVEATGIDAALLRVAQQHLARAASLGYADGPIGSIVHALRLGT